MSHPNDPTADHFHDCLAKYGRPLGLDNGRALGALRELIAMGKP